MKIKNEIVKQIWETADKLLVLNFAMSCHPTDQEKEELNRLRSVQSDLRLNYPREWEFAGDHMYNIDLRCKILNPTKKE